MNSNTWIRQFHRWLSIAFTLAVIINIASMGGNKQPAMWVGLLALVPLALLTFSGLYLFVLPYVTLGRRKLRERAMQGEIT